VGGADGWDASYGEEGGREEEEEMKEREGGSGKPGPKGLSIVADAEYGAAAFGWYELQVFGAEAEAGVAEA
jgi:hypothetical protein